MPLFGSVKREVTMKYFKGMQDPMGNFVAQRKATNLFLAVPRDNNPARFAIQKPCQLESRKGANPLKVGGGNVRRFFNPYAQQMGRNHSRRLVEERQDIGFSRKEFFTPLPSGAQQVRSLGSNKALLCQTDHAYKIYLLCHLVKRNTTNCVFREFLRAL